MLGVHDTVVELKVELKQVKFDNLCVISRAQVQSQMHQNLCLSQICGLLLAYV